MILTSPIEGADPDRLASHSYVETNGIRLHVAEAGEGRPLIFLHGFPENWYSWRNQIRGLSKHFRIIAPDLRGYGLSDRPPSGYDANTVARDLVGLLDALKIQKADIVAHDWGALILWRMAFAHPERLGRICSLNTPHLLAYSSRFIGGSPAESLRFSYMRLLRLPVLPEAILSRTARDFLVGLYRATSYKGRIPMTRGEVLYLANLLSRPGAWEGPLAYYRDIYKSMAQSEHDRSRKLEIPTLLLLGRNDPVLTPGFAEPMREMLGDATFHQIPDCGHWPQAEQPDEVNRAIERFFR